MESIIVSANVVVPLMILMLIGFAVRKSGLVAEDTLIKANKLNYYITVPALCIKKLYESDFSQVSSPKLALTVLFSIIGVSLLCMLIVPRFVKDPPRRGTLIVSLSRANDVIFGLAIAQALFPASELAPFMLSLSISAPLFNLISVIEMEVNRGGRIPFFPTLKRIVLHPIILGCLTGLLLCLTHVTLPDVILSPVSSLAAIATPLSFIIIGSRIHLSAFLHDRKTIAVVSLFRLLIIPAVMLLLARLLHLDSVGMVTILCLFGGPCATVLYAFSCEMDGDEQLSSELIATTSTLAVFTMFLFICILKATGGI